MMFFAQVAPTRRTRLTPSASSRNAATSFIAADSSKTSRLITGASLTAPRQAPLSAQVIAIEKVASYRPPGSRIGRSGPPATRALVGAVIGS